MICTGVFSIAWCFSTLLLLVMAGVWATPLLRPQSQPPHSNTTSPMANNNTQHNDAVLWTAVHDTAGSNTTQLRPIVFLHGINGHADEFYPIMDWMKAKYGPNCPSMHSLSISEGSASLLMPLMEQRDLMLDFLKAKASSLGIDGDGGFNFVAHSQGALLARSVIQKLPSNLRVLTFVSMAGPQRGQWGDCSMSGSGIGPNIAKKMARPVGWLAFYNPIAQRELSFANYWNDPGHQRLFVREAEFLPSVNGYSSDEGNGDMAKQRANFLRVGRAVFLGSADDDCINPPLSSIFQFVDKDGNPASVEESVEYRTDAFGLRKMMEEGRAVLRDCPGNDHMSWMKVSYDESRPSLFEQYVLRVLQ